MKKQSYSESFQLPEGVSSSYENRTITLSKGGVSLKRKVDSLSIGVKADGSSIVFSAEKPGKRERKLIKSYIAHLGNLVDGLDNQYSYKLEACNVHFPMTMKVDKNVLMINNFLGEKTPRKAVILPNVDVQLKGPVITVTSHDKEAAGQTAANMEKATKVRNRDRRIFQDGIYITEKPIGGNR